jgi:hypothetical protein
MPGASTSRSARTRTGEPRGPRLTRISAIHTREELELEAKREALRDQRWRRRRSMLVVACLMTSTGGMAVHATSLLSLLR